ncbi:LytTR family DNA-binding domain-containing protein [Pedobacter xixiisoli]|uniref:LytTr DNA-binding domain-containing protein n=1 Tax=Pedobacter xixiisoli TaxID=1476464 RepID=A0A285ZZP5_9SPHI|nr:LytTR family DNA-binding domain-containing protein [Pedobacter xixiisoli]SOD15122.1 LytTr DNA-binding domain-containing protein [Pedobacter xixiisoli]
MKKPILGKFSYFGRVASLFIAAAATFCLLVYVENPPLVFLLTKINFYLAWLLNTIIAYVVIRGSIWGTRWLDNHHPWQRSYRKRWPRQLLLAVSIPLLFCTLGVSVYFLLYQKNILETNYFTRYLFLDTLAIFLLNGALFFMYQRELSRRNKPERKSEVDQSLDFPLPLVEIAYLYAENKYCYAVGFDGIPEPMEISLTKALTALPEKQFHLVRRSHIVNRSAVMELIKRNNTIQLNLLMLLRLSIRVSRKEMHAFNTWWTEVEAQRHSESKKLD